MNTAAARNSASAPASAVIALAVLALIWGYSWVVMKEVLRYSGPFTFAALRTVFGALALFAVLLVMRKPMKPVALRGTLLLGLLQTAGFVALTQSALVTGGAGRVAVLVYTMPFWVLLLAWPILGERPRGLQWLCVGLAFAGLAFIAGPWRLQASPLANLLAMLAGLSWAASAIVVKRLRSRYQVDLLALTAWQMLLGSLVLVALALLVPERPIEWSTYFIGGLIFNTVLSTALCWLLWIYVLSVLPAGGASLGILASPVVGVLSAWIELGERPSGPDLAGMLLVVAGLALLAGLAMRKPAG